MLQDPSEPALACDLDRVAKLVKTAHQDGVEPLEFVVGAGEGQTPLIVGLKLGCLRAGPKLGREARGALDNLQDRVDQHARALLVLVGGIEHKDALAHTDLRRRQAHPVGGREGLKHVRNEGLQFGVEACNRLGWAAQGGVSVNNDGVDQGISPNRCGQVGTILSGGRGQIDSIVGPRLRIVSASTNPRRYQPSYKYVLMLGAIAAIPAISTDIYLPSLPTVVDEFGSTAVAVQWTITGTLMGGAVGQLVYGPLTDRFGRKRPLLIGLALHVLTSLLCAVAPNIEALIGLRILQGFFNAAASIVAIAVIRDRFTGAAAARLLSQLMLVVGVAPLFAPTIGGFLATHWGWRSSFLFLALVGVALALIVLLRLPETLAEEDRVMGGAKVFASGYWGIIKDRKFLALALMPALAMLTIFAYVVGSPFVFQRQFGLTSGQFALLFAVNGIALVMSAQLNALLVGRFTPEFLLRTGMAIQFGVSVVLVVVAVSGLGGFWGFAAVLWLLLACQGFIGANAQALALAGYGHMVGTAAAVLGALQSAVAGSVSPLVGVFGGDTLAMAAVISAGLLVGLVVLVTATPTFKAPRRNPPRDLRELLDDA